MKNLKKTPNINIKKFNCKPCSFRCNNKNDFKRHLSTTKHLRLTNASHVLTKKTLTKYKCIICEKDFNHRQSLYRHKKICSVKINRCPKGCQKRCQKSVKKV